MRTKRKEFAILSHTLPLDGRSGQALCLTGEEAVELYKQGFRFSVFRPGVEGCWLSLPIETLIDFEAKAAPTAFLVPWPRGASVHPTLSACHLWADGKMTAELSAFGKRQQ